MQKGGGKTSRICFSPLRGLYWKPGSILLLWGETQIQTASAYTDERKHSVAQRATLLQYVHNALNMNEQQKRAGKQACIKTMWLL